MKRNHMMEKLRALLLSPAFALGALLAVIFCVVAEHELSACKLTDEKGVIATVVAVPRYQLCFYMMSLHGEDSQQQPDGRYSAVNNRTPAGAISVERGESAVPDDLWPCPFNS